MWLAALPAIAAMGLTGMISEDGNGRVLAARAAIGSNDPMLTSLTVSAGTLSPRFSGTEVEYSVPDVPYSARVITIMAVPEPGAIVTYWHYPSGTITELVDKDTKTDGFQLSLDVGQKIVEVSLNKGVRYRDYRLKITRLKPTVSIRAVSKSPIYEGGTIEFEIERSAAAADSLAVRVLTKEVEAKVGAGHANVLADKFDDKSPLYYIDGGDATATLDVTTDGDKVWEGHSKVLANIVADDSYNIAVSAGAAAVLVKDNEFLASEAALSVTPNPVGEGAGKTVATVTLTTLGDKKPHGQVSIPISTSDDSAKANSDYTELDQSLVFKEEDFGEVEIDGDTFHRASKSVDIVVLQDALDDEDESFSVALGAPSDSLVALDSDSKTTSVTITDDDDPPPSTPTLSGLTVNPGTLTPAFSSDTLSYTVPDVGYPNSRLTISASADTGTSVTFLDSSNKALADLDSKAAGHQVSLGIGVTALKVRVAKGDASQDYSLSITRAKPLVGVRALNATPATEGDKLEFEVTRSAAAADALTIKFSLAEIGLSTNVIPGDILPIAQEQADHSVTIPAKNTKAKVTVATTGDAVWEEHSYIKLTLVNDGSYTIHATKGYASALVKDDEFLASEAALSVTPNPVGEGAGKTVATVTLTSLGDKKPHGQVSIPVSTLDGTATAASDFTALDATLVFAESDFSEIKVKGNSRFQASKSVDIVVLQDALDDEDESFSVALGAPSDSLVALDSDSKTTSVTITDDEPPSLTALSVSLGTLTPKFSSAQTSYTIPDVGYGTHIATISVSPESGAQASFLDSSNNDYTDLDDETEGHQVYLKIGATTIKVRVEEDGFEQDYTLVFTRAKPTVTIRAVTAGRATEGDTLSFELSRSSAAGDVLEVRVAMDEVGVNQDEGHGDMLPDAVDGTSPLRTIDVDESSLVFSVSTTGDAVWEEHSSIALSIKAESWYDIDSKKSTASIVVLDDEFLASEAALSVTPNPVGEGAGKTVATVTLTSLGDKKPHGQVSIPVSTLDGTATAASDFTALDATLVFAESDFSEIKVKGNSRFQASKSVDIVVLQNALDDDDESFSVALGVPSDSLVTLDSDSRTASVTITDDDDPPPSTPTLSGLTVNVGTLTPAFSSDTLSYTVPDVGYPNSRLTISASADTGTSVTFLDSSNKALADLDSKAAGHQVSLGIGVTALKVRVAKGDASQDYSLSITRAKPLVGVRALNATPATEGDKLEFEVTRSAAAADALTIKFSLAEIGLSTNVIPGDILPIAQEQADHSVTIPAKNTKAKVTVATTGDAVWEEHSYIKLTLVNDGSYTIHATKGYASALVKDDEFLASEAALSVTPNPVGEGAVKTVATVTLTTLGDKKPHGRVSIPISTSDDSAMANSDYTEVDQSLVFKEEDFGEVEIDGDTFYRASKSVDIPILDDKLDEGAETFSVTMGTASQSVVDIDSESRSVVVTINGNNNDPKATVSTLPNHANIPGRGTVSLDGTSTDSDNDKLTYAWTSSPANTGTFGDATSEDTTWTAPAPLTTAQAVTLTLTVTDDGTPMGMTTTDVAVTVFANQPPTVDVTTGDGVVKGGEVVTLSAKASDPEKGALSFQWSGPGIFEYPSMKDTRWVGPIATDAVQTLRLTLTVTDELGLKASDSVALSLSAANENPKFPGTEDGERSIDEGVTGGTRVGAAVTAIDADKDKLSYSLVGADAASFDIDGTGQITVAAGATPDYEAQSTYKVTVQVSDGRDKAGKVDSAVDASLPVRISVKDVEEVGIVTFSPNTLRVGEEVRVSVQDPDNYERSNAVGAVGDAVVASWLWERSDSGDGPWTQVRDAATAAYMLTPEDKGKHFRVTMTYTDRRGSGKSAMGVSGRVGDRIPPAPKLLTVTYSSEAGGLVATWSQPDDGREDPISEYRVEWKQSGIPGCDPAEGWTEEVEPKNEDCQGAVSRTTVSDATYTITGYDGENLVEGDSYSVRVSAGDSLGFGAWSEIANARAPSSDARLSSLMTAPVGLTDFSPDEVSYSITVGHSVTQLTVRAVAADDGAKLDFGDVVDADKATPHHQAALAPGVNLVKIKVTSEDGLSSQVYTIAITKVMGNRASAMYVLPDMAVLNECNNIALSVGFNEPYEAVSYSWSALPDVGHFASKNRRSTLWSAPHPGESPKTVVLTITVSDGRGGTASDSVIVTVSGRANEGGTRG